MNIEGLLPWSAPREVQTKFGPRILRKAEPSETFWLYWRDEQARLKEAGISLGKDKQTGAWEVCWWGKLDDAEREKRWQSAELSRAAASDFEPPCPAGLRFYPFQKAGIDFMRRRPATLLADDMGIGKTIQAIGLINCIPEIKRVLVVTKASLKENWSREVQKWLTRRFFVGIISGSPGFKFGQRLQDLIALNDQEWQNGVEKERNAILLGHDPSVQIAPGLNSFFPQGDLVSVPGVVISSKPQEPVNQTAVGLVNADDPLSAGAANASLPVKDAGQIGSLRQSPGSMEVSSSSAAVNNGKSPLSPLVQKVAVSGTKLSGKSPGRQAGVEGAKASEDSCIREARFHGFCLIINYDLVHKYQSQLRTVRPWDLIILDESAAIKNRDAKRTQAVVGRLARPSKDIAAIPPLPATRRLCLSGTPMENRPQELWTSLYFLAPETWGSFWSYAKRYCGMVSNGYGVDTTGASNLEELQRRLRETIMIRRRKAEVLTELPPKTRQVVEIEAEGIDDIVAEEKRCLAKYNEELEAAQVKLELARASESDEEFKAAVKALASSTAAFEEIARVRHVTAVSKVPFVLEALKEDIEETGSNKVLVFAHHRDVIAPLARAFPRSLVITGETPPTERQGICDVFQQDPEAGPFFGSIRACGEGLTLTAAKLVVFAEEDWVPGKVSQAEDRAHRIGQKDNVLVKHYILPGTIDAHMIQTIIAKQEVIDKAMDTDPGEWATEPVFVPRHEPIGRRKEIQEESLLITGPQVEAIHAALARLAGVCDGALQLDEVGFNRIDSRIGKELAALPVLTVRQAALGRRICRKYVRQLGEAAVKAMG